MDTVNSISPIANTIRPKTDLTPSQMREAFGDAGTSLMNGYIDEEYNTLFQWTKAYETYDEMYRSDDTVWLTLMSAQLPIVSADRYINAYTVDGEVSPKDKEIADFIHKCLFDRMEQDREDRLWECVQMLRDGVSVFEIIMKMQENKYVIKELAVRLPKSIEKWETEDGAPGITQQLPQASIESGTSRVSIPGQKLLVFSYRKEGKNYAWLSPLRQVAKARVCKKTLSNFELIGYETQFRWVRKVRVDPNQWPAEKEEYLKTVSEYQVANDNTIVLPWTSEQFDFSFETMDLPQAEQLRKTIKDYDAKITDWLMAFFIKLGQSEKWSYGMARTNMDFFIMGLEFVAKKICRTLNKFIIKRLVDINFGPQEWYPELSYGTLGSINTKELADTISTAMSSNAITPDLETEQWLRDKFGMPTKKGDKQTPIVKEVPQAPSDTWPVKASEWCGCGNCESHEFNDYSSLVDPSLMISMKSDISFEDVSKLKKKHYTFNNDQVDGRPLTFAELKMNLPLTKRKFSELETRMQSGIEEITAKQRTELMQQIKTAIENNDLKGLQSLSVPYVQDLSKLIIAVRKDAFDFWKDSASSEMGVSTPSTTDEQKLFMTIESKQLAQRLSDNMLAAAQWAISQEIARNAWSIETLTTATAIRNIAKRLDDIITKGIGAIQTLSVVGSINTGRGTVYASYPEDIYAFQYTAVLDNRTTDRCLSLDGRVVAPWSSEYANYSPPQHYRCRSLWVSVGHDETFKPKITGVPWSISPVTNIDIVEPMNWPQILRGWPAMNNLKQELWERKEKLKILEESGKYPNRQEQHKIRIQQLDKALWVK